MASRCPKAFRGAILGQKVEKIVKNDVGSKNGSKINENVFLLLFFHGSDAPGLQKSVRGTAQGPPGDSPAGFFGAGWLVIIGPRRSPEPFRGPETPQGAARGALRRSGTPF